MNYTEKKFAQSLQILQILHGTHRNEINWFRLLKQVE